MQTHNTASGLVNLNPDDPTSELRERLIGEEFEKIEFVENGMPGIPWTDIAAQAYLAYAASTGNKNYQGLPMPPFADLPLPIQTAWEAAIRQAHRCRVINHALIGISCVRFGGWVRPQDRVVNDRGTMSDGTPII